MTQKTTYDVVMFVTKKIHTCPRTNSHSVQWLQTKCWVQCVCFCSVLVLLLNNKEKAPQNKYLITSSV